jgi:hypothetical protein
MAILLLLLQLLFGAAPSAAALIDGSFESLLTNWSRGLTRGLTRAQHAWLACHLDVSLCGSLQLSLAGHDTALQASAS